jgi:hypothetical protein
MKVRALDTLVSRHGTIICARFFPIKLLGLLIGLIFPVDISAQFTYITNQGSIVITGVTLATNEIVIPSSVNALPVTQIASLTNRNDFTSFVKRVVIPDSVTNIADRVFYDWRITNVVLGAGLTSIGKDAFTSCDSLKSFTVDPANAAYTAVSGVLYDKPQSTLVIFPGGLGGRFIIPDGVTQIARSAFCSNNILTGVVMPATLTTIGPSAFSSCFGLTFVTNGPGVLDIGDSAFTACQQLSKVVLNASLTNIGREAFFRCPALTSISISNAVVGIGERAFASCAKLDSINVDPSNPSFSSVNGVLFDKTQTTLLQFPAGKIPAYTVPNSVSHIGDSAFYGCASIPGVRLPDTLTQIGTSAFELCSKLAKINLPDGLPEIPDRAFYRCASLTNIVIPNTVTNIGNSAFFLTRPSSLQIPNSVISIGDHAFAETGSFGSVTIPDSVTSLGEFAFVDCTFLATVVVGTGISNLPADVFHNCMFLRSVTMTTNITAIRDSAFSGCSYLANITLPDTVTNIGSFSFGFTYSLTNITIPPKVTRIADFAFYSSALTDISIPNSVSEIGTNAFERCHSLTNVSIPASVSYLGVNAFNETTSLQQITVDPLNTVYSSRDGVLFNRDQSLLIYYPHAKIDTAYAVPSGVIMIADSAFRECNTLRNVTFPNTLTTIGQTAFTSSTNLTELTLPDSLTSLGKVAFGSCTDLGRVAFGGNLAKIEDGAFSSCGSITNLILSEGLRNIGANAFAYCTNLTNVHLPDTVETLSPGAFSQSGLTNIVIGPGLIAYDISALEQCLNLLTISVSAQNTTFSDIDGVLFDKEQTTLLLYPRGRPGSYTIPDQTRSIANSAFHISQLLTSVTVPAGVTNISDFAFYVCPNLATVYFRGDRPTAGRNIFWAGNNVISYYLPTTSGWDSTFGGLPAVAWNPSAITDANFGLRGNQFGFDITGTSGLVIIVEASDTLSNPQWTPISTNTLAEVPLKFDDAAWRNHQSRLYRFRSP